MERVVGAEARGRVCFVMKRLAFELELRALRAAVGPGAGEAAQG